MANPTGGLRLIAQPVKIESTTSSKSKVSYNNNLSVSEIVGKVDLNLSPALITIERNHDSFYLNPDLESILNTRGFSTQRAEILGMFNYIAPLAKGADDDDTENFLITAAGELYDFQCQLKQLRYKDALGFLEKMIGMEVSQLGEGIGLKILAGRGPGGKLHGFEDRRLTDAELIRNKKLLQNYGREMKLARAVLDYLQRIYDAISSFIEAQELSKSYNMFNPVYLTALIQPIIIGADREKSSQYNASEAPPASQDCFNKISTIMPPVDTGIAIFTAKPFELEYETSAKFNEFLAAAYNLSDYASEDFIKDISKSSGTAQVLNMLNIVAAGVYGVGAFPSPFWIGSTSTARESASYTGQLVGYESVCLTPTTFWSCFAEEELSVSIPDSVLGGEGTLPMLSSPKITSSDGGEITSDELFSRLNYYAYLPATTKADSRDSLVTYLVGLDTIQSFRYSTMGTVSGFGIPATGGSSAVESLLTSMYGRNVKDTLSSIASSIPSPGETNITRCILAKNNDTTQTDTRSYVETFTQTNADLAQGVQAARTGRSYYCDEIPTNEIDESKVRIADLKSKFDTLSDMVAEMLKLSTCSFPDSSSYLDDSSLQYGYSQGKEGKIVPGTFYNYLLKALADSTRSGFTQNYDDQEDPTNSYLFNFVIAAMASTDDEIAYLVTCLNLAYCDYQDGEITQDQLKDVAFMLEYRACEKIREDFLEAVENGTAKGDGHCVWYGYGPALDGEIEHPNIYDHKNGKGMSSSYRYFPLDSDGILLEKSGGGFEAIEEGAGVIYEQFSGKSHYWGGTSISEPPKNILLVPYFTVKKFSKDVRRALGVSSSVDWGYSIRGYGKKSKIAAVTNMCRNIWKESFRNSVYFQYETTRTTSSAGKSDYTFSSTTVRALLAMNVRSALSLINAAEMMTGDDIFSPYNFRKRGNPNDDHISGYAPRETKDDVFKDGESGSASTSHGHNNTIQNLCQDFKAVAKENAKRERIFFGSAALVLRAMDQLQAAGSNLLTAIESTDLESSTFDNALGEIRSDPDFSRAALFGITRDQLSLNRSLYDSFSSPNREYPYIPATKAVLPNETKNLSAFLKQPDFLESSADSTRRFICPVGIPAGMMESLRMRMMDETGDTSYRESTLVEVSVWKRDLLHENIVYNPQRFVFDTSCFIITGRSTPTSAGANLLDSAVTALEPQEFSRLKSKTVVRKYTPGGNSKAFLGKVTGNAYYGEGVNSTSIFNNHVNDHYLQVFSKLTTGFDFSEDVFPFLEGNIFFDGVDNGNEALFNQIEQKAKEMFVDIDLESALNYDRLLGEMKRSIYLSPKKYRNRIIYPKVFERVFCVLIDPDSFTIKERGLSQFSPAPTELPLGNYTQYYVTVGIKPPEGSEEYTYQFEALPEAAQLSPDSVTLADKDLVDSVSPPNRDFIKF